MERQTAIVIGAGIAGMASAARLARQGCLEILEFDAHRKGRPISQGQLTWYSDCLVRSATDAIQYFVGNDHPYHDGHGR